MSFDRALQTRAWNHLQAAVAEPVYDRRRIDEWLALIGRWEAYWRDVFGAEGAPVLPLAYDDLVADRIAALDRVARFLGPNALAALALATEDPEERRRALAEAEAILADGCVGHNYLRGYPDAAEAALRAGEWSEAERYASALEDYTRPEPLPWADFFTARGRALAAHGRGWRDSRTAEELRRLGDEGKRLGLKVALPAIEEALAATAA